MWHAQPPASPCDAACIGASQHAWVPYRQYMNSLWHTRATIHTHLFIIYCCQLHSSCSQVNITQAGTWLRPLALLPECLYTSANDHNLQDATHDHCLSCLHTDADLCHPNLNHHAHIKRRALTALTPHAIQRRMFEPQLQPMASATSNTLPRDGTEVCFFEAGNEVQCVVATIQEEEVKTLCRMNTHAVNRASLSLISRLLPSCLGTGE